MNLEKINVGGNEYDICDAKTRAMVSDEYDPEGDYVAGDLCIHDNKLHEAKGPTTGAWDSTKWEGRTLAEVLKSQNSNIENKVSLADINNDNLDDFRSGMHFSNAAILQGRGLGALWEYQYEIGGMYYGAQLYLSYADGIQYRSRSENAWGSWKSIVTPP